jgi:pimeloyl-ACP methyl ester carboxylesterase
MTQIELEGVHIEVTHIAGPDAKSPLVFLHEGLGSISTWTQRGRNWPAELCAATGRAGWLYSRRGYGQSDPVPDVRGPHHPPDRTSPLWSTGRHAPDYMHREAVGVLPALFKTLGITAPLLVGHSDGATIALIHASLHHVSACVAIAPHAFIEDMTIRSIERARDSFLADSAGLRAKLARHHLDADNAFWQWNDIWLSADFRDFDILPECRSLTAPLLLMQGLDDEYGSLRQLQDIAQAAPHAQMLTLPGCGHSPHRDAPDAATEAIRAFVDKRP